MQIVAPMKLPAKSQNILIVDDLLENLHILTHLLIQNGYKIRTATTGWSAIDSIQEEIPDLILLDIVLPDIDGFEVCEKIKSNALYKDIPVIFISALTKTKDILKGFSVGGIDYITKPFIAEEVLARVKTQIEISLMRKQILRQSEELKRVNQEALEQSEGKLQEKIKDLGTIAEASSILLEIDSKERIYEFIRDFIHPLSGADYLMISEFDEKSQSSSAKHLFGADNKIQKINKILGLDMQILRIPVENLAEQRGVGFGKKINQLIGGVYEFVVQKIPKPICLLVEKIIGLHQLFSIGFVWDDRFFGEIALGYRKRSQIVKIDLLETIINQISLALSRIQAKELLLSKEEKYRSIFENIQDVYYETDLTGIVLELSPSISLLSKGQYKREDLIGKYIFDNYQDKEARQKLVQELKSKKRLLDYEIVLKNRDGYPIYCSVSAEMQLDSKNKSAKIIGAFHDISERIKAEESVLKLSLAVEQSPVSIIITDIQGVIEYGNPKIAEITGYTLNEIIGKKTNLFRSGEKSKSDYKKLWDTILSGNVWQGEFHNRKKNGELFWELASISPLKNEDGEITRFVAIKEDITQRKKLEETKDILVNISNAVLATDNFQSFSKFIFAEIKQIIHTNNFYIALYDEQTQMISTPFIADQIDANLTEFPAKNTLTGYVINSRKSMLIDEKEFLEHIEKGDFELIGPISERWIGVPLFNRDDVIGAIVVQNYKGEKKLCEEDLEILEYIAPQISLAIERKKKVLELKAALEKAQESDRLKSAFLANMSHEIRTPMNGILGFTSLLKEPKLSGEEQHDFIAMIEKSGARMLNTIKDLIDISTIESGQVSMLNTKTNLNDQIDQVLEFFKPEIEKKGMKLFSNVPFSSEEVYCYTDNEKLDGILLNLVKNAIKYSNKGSIEIGFTIEENHFQFFVKDEGIGIPEEKLAAIFDRFVQVDSSFSSNYEGAGLGLSIAKAYIELLKGDMWVESKVDFGSTFYFTIPKNK